MAHTSLVDHFVDERLGALSRRWEHLLPGFPTPCVVIDLESARRNAAVAADRARAHDLVIRPHAKAHKCSTLLRMQLSFGSASGVTCATPYEALELARLGFDDILVANEVVSEVGERLLGAVASRVRRLRIAVDSEVGIERAGHAARLSDAEIGVLVDLDVGSGRCGVQAEGGDVTRLARHVEATPRLQLEGLMAYTGRANYFPNRADRGSVAEDVRLRVERAKTSLTSDGFPATIISGGGTGLWDFGQGLTELQLGSYVLMEGRYATVGLPFEIALFCAATVVSRAGSGHAVLDCGWKALSAEFGNPLLPSWLTPRQFSDEHLICEVARGASLEVGDVILLVPAHLDPTMNLHDYAIVVDGTSVAHWAIDLRRRSLALQEISVE